MRSGFKKIIIVVVVIFIIALSFWVGVVFFAKNNITTKTMDDQQEKQQINDLNKKPEITEKEKTKSFAENFIEVYNTYAIGDFSNIESLKDNILQWIEIEKEKTKDSPKRYIVFNTQINKSNIIYFDDSETTIEIEYEQVEIRGASIYIENILTDVDEFGEIILVQIPRKSETKKVVVKLIKKDDEWKVDNIEIVKNWDQN